VGWAQNRRQSRGMGTGAVLWGARGLPPLKKNNCGRPVAPQFGPASLDFHLNRPVISLIQLQNHQKYPLFSCILCPPATPAGIVPPIGPPIWPMPEPPLDGDHVCGTSLLPRKCGHVFLMEARKQSAVATLRRKVNETSINDYTSDKPDSARAV